MDPVTLCALVVGFGLLCAVILPIVMLAASTGRATGGWRPEKASADGSGMSGRAAEPAATSDPRG